MICRGHIRAADRLARRQGGTALAVDEVKYVRFRRNANQTGSLYRNLIRQKSEIFDTFPKGEGYGGRFVNRSYEGEGMAGGRLPPLRGGGYGGRQVAAPTVWDLHCRGGVSPPVRCDGERCKRDGEPVPYDYNFKISRAVLWAICSCSLWVRESFINRCISVTGFHIGKSLP